LYHPNNLRFLLKFKNKLNNIFLGFPTGKTNPKTQISSFLTKTVIPTGRKIQLAFNYLNYKG